MSDKYYVSGCIEAGGSVECTCDDEAQFWTLYAREPNGESQGVVDFVFREDAVAAMAVYVERDALQQQAQQLAAENAALKDAGDYLAQELYAITDDTETDLRDACESWYAIKAPIADAWLNEIRAQGVELFADELGHANVTARGKEYIKAAGRLALTFAAKLRGSQSKPSITTTPDLSAVRVDAIHAALKAVDGMDADCVQDATDRDRAYCEAFVDGMQSVYGQVKQFAAQLRAGEVKTNG